MTTDRLRAHPTERFSVPERKIDFDACYDDLIGEAHEPVDGHRQITIARHATLTLILFYFEADSRLPEHVVDGDVTIQVLAGELDVKTDQKLHHLQDNQLLILEGGIEHDLHALVDTRMLLTVHLDD